MPILVGSKSERTSRSGTGTSISETKSRHSNRSRSKFKSMKLRYKQVSCAHYASNHKNIRRVYVLQCPISITTHTVPHFPPSTTEMNTTVHLVSPQMTTQQLRKLAWRPTLPQITTCGSLHDQRIGWGVSNIIGNLIPIRCTRWLWYIQHCSREH